jgi:3-hydroxyisobutyrate dehydrogenase
MKKIGFIGLGNMGLPMATNLIKAGYEVIGFDIEKDNLEKFVTQGGAFADNIAHSIKDAKIIITMLPTGQIVKNIMLDKGGVFENAQQGTLLIDCSTIDVASAREISKKAIKSGFDFVDAPVSGGVMGAEQASLTFMCGGEEKAFKRAKTILINMGKNIIHAGSAGNGQAAKTCNNMLLGISMIGVSEAFNLADALGLERQKLFDIASTASGQCWSLNTYCPVPGPVPKSPANNDYRAGFSTAMMLKDLLLSQDAAKRNNVSTPLGQHASELYQAFNGTGNENLDFSAIIKYLREQ